MRAGRLDREITIERATDARGTSGAVTKTWATLATVPAEVRPKRGREFFAAGQVAGEVDTVFRIYWRSDITVKDRISYGGRTYDITSLGEIGRKEVLEIMATARAE